MKSKRSIECWLFHPSLKQFLLLQCPETDRHPQYWQPVTGGVRREENYMQACLREVVEETGIRLDVSDIVTVIRQYKVWVPEYNLEVRKPIFTVETSVEEIRISDEHLAYQWVPLHEVESWLFWDSSKATFQKVKAFYEQCDL
ncbi:MAG: NUDIX domain-containing protein [bacterium]|nr:NUDIX domain-containing protein [bacterium]